MLFNLLIDEGNSKQYKSAEKRNQGNTGLQSNKEC